MQWDGQKCVVLGGFQVRGTGSFCRRVCIIYFTWPVAHEEGSPGSCQWQTKLVLLTCQVDRLELKRQQAETRSASTECPATQDSKFPEKTFPQIDRITAVWARGDVGLRHAAAKRGKIRRACRG